MLRDTPIPNLGPQRERSAWGRGIRLASVS